MNPTIDSATQERIEKLERTASILLGRMNGLASLIVVMASTFLQILFAAALMTPGQR